jgi:REP element-mobilizing transposase RayT
MLYVRRLPHLSVIGRSPFITWRLHGSLPKGRPFPAGMLTSAEAFAAMDRLLDRGRTGPLFLRDAEMADMIVDALRFGDATLGHYALHAFVVMANHVHILVTPSVELPVLTKSLKTITARRANAMLRRTGQPFWNEESYDHLVRSPDEFTRISRYIEINPVRAGLVQNPADFRWSSASP